MQVAVPDYAGGAMENWGLITFRESYLLADPTSAGLQEQLGVASIVAHEMSHMVRWLGIRGTAGNVRKTSPQLRAAGAAGRGT